MNSVKQKLSQFITWIKTPRGKKTMYAAAVVVVICWVLFRFIMIGIERHMVIFNPARNAAQNGVPVVVMKMQKTDGVIKQALTVKNNRAYVSGVRAASLRAGQSVGDGVIVSVGTGIDLDTGMHVVHTRGVADGMHLAEFKANGYFVPAYAVDNNTVFVVRDGVANAMPVTVGRSDAEYAYITSGIADGDVIILSRVADGDKVDIKQGM